MRHGRTQKQKLVARKNRVRETENKERQSFKMVGDNPFPDTVFNTTPKPEANTSAT